MEGVSSLQLEKTFPTKGKPNQTNANHQKTARIIPTNIQTTPGTAEPQLGSFPKGFEHQAAQKIIIEAQVSGHSRDFIIPAR